MVKHDPFVRPRHRAPALRPLQQPGTDPALGRRDRHPSPRQVERRGGLGARATANASERAARDAASAKARGVGGKERPATRSVTARSRAGTVGATRAQRVRRGATPRCPCRRPYFGASGRALLALSSICCGNKICEQREAAKRRRSRTG